MIECTECGVFARDEEILVVKTGDGEVKLCPGCH